MLLDWPLELSNQYAHSILYAIHQMLGLLQRASMSSDTTIAQLCQAMGCAAAFADLAGDVQQAASNPVQCSPFIMLASFLLSGLLQDASMSADITITQLCQAMGCAAAFKDLADDVQQAATLQVALQHRNQNRQGVLLC